MAIDKEFVTQVISRRFSKNSNSIVKLDRLIVDLLAINGGSALSGIRIENEDITELGFVGSIFNARYYGYLYPDVSAEICVHHYLEFGRFEKRWPNPFFESDYYSVNHAKICGNVKSEEIFDALHFLSCNQFTCPTPLLNIENGSDLRGAKRAEYLAAITGLSDADLIAHELFDPLFYDLKSTSIETHAELRTHGFGSLIGRYAFLSANAELFSINQSCNVFIDEQHVNHQLAGNQFPRSILSWILIHNSENKGKMPPGLSLAKGYDLSKVLSNFESDFSLSVAQDSIRRIRNSSGRNAATLDTKKISVFVICLNDSEIVISSLATLLAYQSNYVLEILILDNNSEKDHVTNLKAMIPSAVIVSTDHLVSFGEANNILADYCTGDFILFLNSDAFLPATELDKLVIAVDDNDEAVAAAPILIYPDGRIQEAGGGWFSDGSVVQFAKGLYSMPAMDASFENRYRSAACLLVRKEVFLRVGGFSFVFDPAYYEDTYLCAEISKFGKIETVKDAICVHLEGHTNNSTKYREIKARAVNLNRATFTSRITSLDVLPIEYHEKFQSDCVKTAIVASPYGLMIGGGEQYIFSLARHLSKSYQVTLAFPSIPSASRFKRVLSELGIEFFPVNVVSIENARSMKPDLLVSMGNSIHPNFPPIGSVSVYHCQFPFPEGDSYSKTQVDWAKNYDALIVNSRFTATNIQKNDKFGVWNSKTRVICPPVNALGGGDLNQEVGKNRKFKIVSVGRFFRGDHCKNQVALIEAFSRLDTSVVKSELILIGGVAHSDASVDYFEEVLRSMVPNVILKPNCSRFEVLNELKSSDLYWHGAGFNVSENEPWKMEHFGITPVEACQLAVPPLVPSNGGVGENISKLGDRYTYSSLEDLISKSELMMSQGTPDIEKKELVEFGSRFSLAIFEKNLDNLLSDLVIE